MRIHSKLTTQSKIVTGLFICLATLPLSSPAHAGSVTINNFSFENDVLGFGNFTNDALSSWTVGFCCGAVVGAYNPNTFSAPVPDGSNTAYVNPGGSFYQDVAALAANSTYNFTVYVGQRTDIGLPSYSIQLLDATTSAVLASGIPSPPASGFFVNFGLSFDSASFASSVGDPIRIEFSAPFVSDVLEQVNFDDVTLGFSADSAPGTPEPSSFGLTLLGIGVMAIACRKWLGKVFPARS